ncbi:MAG: 3'-5' exonuclease [Legionellaceae bacterium]|nr:3'-5' exonuclease [Legionellaceae bacterium]HCA89606.1 3'-5' exonuclease [Legionellales bacterium]|tara:strand:+ start:819 stop:1604 length:786 start_codon:yes stop_codon:yes gene_type:complete
MSYLIFDIETVPDVVTGRKIYELDGLSDEDTASAMFALRRAKVNHEFLPHHLQKIVAISLLLVDKEEIKVWSLGDLASSEENLISRFFAGIDKYTPTLVSWNGSGFDLPVLHYRALLHGIRAANYWEYGERQSGFKWNNYLNRFHYRHLDLMDVLASYQNKAFAPLDEIATMQGFPGKMGMSGSKVWQNYLAGQLQSIRDYCETDVLNTYCVFLKFEMIRTNISAEHYHATLTHLINYLQQDSTKPHLVTFAKKLAQGVFG